jgi:hypothetical protein
MPGPAARGGIGVSSISIAGAEADPPRRNANVAECLSPSGLAFTPSDEAINRTSPFSGPVIVDLDETLYLANSTEDYINLLRPYILACYVLRALDIVQPWRWTHQSHRDNWRVMLVTVLFPWTILKWKRFCRTTGTERFNARLLSTLLARDGRVIVATNGYRRLVQPLLMNSPAAEFELISCGLRRFKDRGGGKAALVSQRIGKDIIAQSAVITDSMDDRDILELCRLPILTKWEGVTRNRKPRDFAYIPVDYLHRVKQPNQRVWRILLREDVAPWVLLCLSAIAVTGSHVLGSILLFASLWAVYEAGYFDNDNCAVKYETDPKVKPEFYWFSNRYLEIYCWVWALGLGAIASMMLRPSDFVPAFACWCLALVACRLCYHLYNRIDKASRVFLYPALQAFRFGAPIVIVEISSVGVAIIISQILPRWFEYSLYRFNHQPGIPSSWPKTPTRTIRLVTFVLLMAGLTIAKGYSAFMTPATGVIVFFAYSAWRSEGRSIRKGLSRIDRSSTSLAV